MKAIGTLLLLILVPQIIGNSIRTLLLSEIMNTEYQCNDLGCSSHTAVNAANLLSCQITCLNDNQCRTTTYDLASHRCALFSDIPSAYGELLPHAGVVTMTTIDQRRLSARKYGIFEGIHQGRRSLGWLLRQNVPLQLYIQVSSSFLAVRTSTTTFR